MILNIVVALAAEAAPLREHFGLTMAKGEQTFPHYANANIHLVVSGPGQEAAATATRWLAERSTAGIWLNIGVAGHASRDIGEAFIAGKVIDTESDKCWYPAQTIKAPWPVDTLYTVTEPDFSYTRDGGIDMEAAGFLAACGLHTTAELAQCLKIVSDNPDSAKSPTKQQLRAAISAHLPKLDSWLQQLESLANRYSDIQAEPESLADFTARWHFTVSETHQLRRLLVRWQALHGDAAPMLDTMRDGKAVLRTLREQLDSRVLQLGTA